MYEERDLADLFMKEKEYYNYTLEEFKVWLKKTAPEEDWSDINRWGVLDHFTTLPLRDFRIFEYLFQLGMDPFFLYIDSIESALHLENSGEEHIAIIKKYKDISSLCEKYMTSKKIEDSLYVINNPEDV